LVNLLAQACRKIARQMCPSTSRCPTRKYYNRIPAFRAVFVIADQLSWKLLDTYRLFEQRVNSGKAAFGEYCARPQCHGTRGKMKNRAIFDGKSVAVEMLNEGHSKGCKQTGTDFPAMGSVAIDKNGHVFSKVRLIPSDTIRSRANRLTPSIVSAANLNQTTSHNGNFGVNSTGSQTKLISV